MATIPAPHCEHSADTLVRRSFRLECSVCGSYWDTESLDRVVAYDASYPAARGHFDRRVGKLKVRTLASWLKAGAISLEGKQVCEVGFGGGACLALLADGAAHVIGLEANGSVIERLRREGSPAEFHLVDALPAQFGKPIDLWIFQDSFEHLPDPASFVDWMVGASAATAEILLVAPRGDSLSRRLMGRWWPHKLPDHQFQWSRKGLVEFMARRHFRVCADFFPLKFISPQMAVAHVLHKFGANDRVRKFEGGAEFAIPFNFGELGMVFRRDPNAVR